MISRGITRALSCIVAGRAGSTTNTWLIECDHEYDAAAPDITTGLGFADPAAPMGSRQRKA